jgi:hypothetical protein
MAAWREQPMTGLSICEAPSWDGRRTAALAHPPFEAASRGALMLGDAEKEARQRGYQAMVGPMAAGTWGSYRLMMWSDDSPAFVGEPRTGPYDLEAYLRARFAVAETHFSAAAAPGPRGFETAGSPDVIVAAWDGRDPAALLAEAHGVVMRAFAKTAFFRPIPCDRFVAAYLPGLAQADPRFVFAARDPTGRSVGFALAYPDPIRKGAIVLKTYAALAPGIGRRMADIVHSRAAESGFTEVIHALMRDGVTSASQSRKVGGRPIRRYALMGKIL